MMKHFTHLHLHTDYSLLDGAIPIDKLIAFGKKHNFKALAITDHGNIFGAVKFFQQCKKANIKPILGMEAYFTEDVALKNVNQKYYHLIILVQNSVGYRNLCKLIAFSYQQGFYFKPRIDYSQLEKHADGLIVTSACLGGHIPKLLMNNDLKTAHQRIDWFLDIFGRDRFYFEVQPGELTKQAELNKKLFALAQEKNIKVIATGDCHYVSLDDHEAHEIMLAIQTHDKIDNPGRFTFGDCRVPIRSTKEMLTIFSNHEQAVWNTGVIADSCEFDFETGKLFFPKFAIPEKYTPESYFKTLCLQGLQQLKNNGSILVEQEQQYEDRLTVEIELITNMGFVGYFLVVSDFIQWARHQNIPVGPGRGSVAGSLVAWALQITNIDPLKHNLLFERFLNPERVSMPDIDIDFCIEGRDTVLEYVRNKYGHDKVCHIITFGTMMAKGVIKDVARVLGFSFEDSNAMTSLIPDQLKIKLKDAIAQEPRLQKLIDNNPKAKKLFDIAFTLEGLTRHASKHAAGIVISPEPIDEVLPVYIPSKSNDLVTQYAMTELESIGFLKIDFLGLKNLTLIDRVVKLIKQKHHITLDINKLPLDDSHTFSLICEGKTSGVFQLESDGLKEVLRKLRPEKFEDIIAVNALYRPGPLGSGMVNDFIERKNGRQKIEYLLPELKPILQETYGVIIYQEQVMKIASVIAGYSLGEADILRRAMGKKKADVMQAQCAKFVKQAIKRGFNKKKVQELFDLMGYFAGYGFNKSHSAAYALIMYQTAYLKANYTAEFLACLLSLETSNADKMAFYLQETKDRGITISPPDINTSMIDFVASNNNVLFGLQGIKNVGLAALETIITERKKKGPFVDLLDFCKRIDLRTANKRVIENLIYAGALDNLPGNRTQQHHELAHIIEQAIAYKKDAATGQMGLFASMNNNKNKNHVPHTFEPRAEWSHKKKLEKEKEVIGFYVSGHPLETYAQQLRWFNFIPFDTIFSQIKNQKNGKEFTTSGCGLLKNRKDIFTKKGDRMTFIQLEDMSGTAEIVVFPKLFSRVEQWLDSYHVFIVKGIVDNSLTKQVKIKADKLVPIELLFQEWKQIEAISIILPQHIDEATLQKLKEQFITGTIPLELILSENDKHLRFSAKEKIALDIPTAQLLEKEYGVTLQCRL